MSVELSRTQKSGVGEDKGQERMAELEPKERVPRSCLVPFLLRSFPSIALRIPTVHNFTRN